MEKPKGGGGGVPSAACNGGKLGLYVMKELGVCEACNGGVGGGGYLILKRKDQATHIDKVFYELSGFCRKLYILENFKDLIFDNKLLVILIYLVYYARNKRFCYLAV